MADSPTRLFHASPSVNRESIRVHGLDVSRMSVDGIAGSTLPEVEGVFLAESFWDGFWYASFGRHSSVDIWNVRADGLALREDNEGWICSSVIPPDRLTLVETDLSPETADAWLDAQTPYWLKTNGEAEPETEPQSGFTGYISGDRPPTA